MREREHETYVVGERNTLRLAMLTSNPKVQAVAFADCANVSHGLRDAAADGVAPGFAVVKRVHFATNTYN